MWIFFSISHQTSWKFLYIWTNAVNKQQSHNQYWNTIFLFTLFCRSFLFVDKLSNLELCVLSGSLVFHIMGSITAIPNPAHWTLRLKWSDKAALSASGMKNWRTARASNGQTHIPACLTNYRGDHLSTWAINPFTCTEEIFSMLSVLKVFSGVLPKGFLTTNSFPFCIIIPGRPTLVRITHYLTNYRWRQNDI